MKYIENEFVELKSTLTEDTKNEIIAFLNTSGGTIYVGLNDDGSIFEPFKEINKDLIDLKISNWINDVFYPSTFGLIRHRFNADGILVIKISEGKNKPYYLKDKGPKPSGVYKRVGSSSRKATEDEILKMILESKKYIYENDISEEQDLTFKYLIDIFKEKQINFSKREQISLGIINKDGLYTNLAYLLSDQSNLTVKLAEYDSDLNFKIKKEFKGPVIKIFKDLEEQVNRMNDVSAIIDGKTFERKETKSFPGASLREAILNAVCHANYFIRSNIKIEFYPHEMKITNPGGIFNATMEDIMNGVQTYRNPKLVHILDKLNVIENYGTGIPRIINAYKESYKPPIFFSTENFFTVRLPNLNYDDTINDSISDSISDSINDSINDSISDSIKNQTSHNISNLGLIILKIIKENPGINTPKITDLVKNNNIFVDFNKIKNEIRRNLLQYIEFRGSNKNGGYYIKNIELEVENEIIKTEKGVIETEKGVIETEKRVIETEKGVIEEQIEIIERSNYQLKIKNNLKHITLILSNNSSFSGKDIMTLLFCKNKSSYKLIKCLKELQLIEPIFGKGKGKYRFKK